MDNHQLLDNPAPAEPSQAAKRSAPRRRGADAYDTLLWRLQPRLEEASQLERGVGYLAGVTSCDRKAGVSTVAANLAIRAADHQMRPVLLVEGAVERPTMARKFRLRKAAGLADVLAGSCSIADAIHETEVEGLQVMPIGTPGLMDRVGVDHEHVSAMLRGLRESHEFIVFDLPPADRLRHMLLVARRLDAALLAIRSEATGAERLQRVATQLRSDQVNLVGSVVARRRQYVPSWLRRRV